MKKFVYPLLGIILLLCIMQFSYDPFVSVTGLTPCKEGCSAEFKTQSKYIFITVLTLTIGICYGYAIRKINSYYLVGFFILFFIFYLIILWYSALYGYGLNYSY